MSLCCKDETLVLFVPLVDEGRAHKAQKSALGRQAEIFRSMRALPVLIPSRHFRRASAGFARMLPISVADLNCSRRNRGASVGILIIGSTPEPTVRTNYEVMYHDEPAPTLQTGDYPSGSDHRVG